MATTVSRVVALAAVLALAATALVAVDAVPHRLMRYRTTAAAAGAVTPNAAAASSASALMEEQSVVFADAEVVVEADAVSDAASDAEGETEMVTAELVTDPTLRRTNSDSDVRGRTTNPTPPQERRARSQSVGRRETPTVNPPQQQLQVNGPPLQVPNNSPQQPRRNRIGRSNSNGSLKPPTNDAPQQQPQKPPTRARSQSLTRGTGSEVPAPQDLKRPAVRGFVKVKTTFRRASGQVVTVEANADGACELALYDGGRPTPFDDKLWERFEGCPGLLAALRDAFGLHVTPKHTSPRLVARLTFAGGNAPQPFALPPQPQQTVPGIDPTTTAVTVELHDLVAVHAIRRSVAGTETPNPVLCGVGPRNSDAFTFTADMVATCKGAVLAKDIDNPQHFREVGRPNPLPQVDAQIDQDYVVVFQAWAEVAVRAFIGGEFQKTGTNCGATANAHGTYDDTLVALCAAQLFDPKEFNFAWTTADVRMIYPMREVGAELTGEVTVVLASQTVLLRVVGPNDAVVAERLYAVGGAAAAFTLNDDRINAVAHATLDDAHITLHHSGGGKAKFTVGDLIRVDQPDGKQKVAKFTANRPIAGGAGSVLYLRQPAVVKAHAADANPNTAVPCYLVQKADNLTPAPILAACAARVAPNAAPPGFEWTAKDVTGLAKTHGDILAAGDVTLVVTPPQVVGVQVQGSQREPVFCRTVSGGAGVTVDNNLVSDCAAKWYAGVDNELEKPIGKYGWKVADIAEGGPRANANVKKSFVLVLSAPVIVTASRAGTEDRLKCASDRSGKLKLADVVADCAVRVMHDRNVYGYKFTAADLEGQAPQSPLVASVHLSIRAPIVVTGKHQDKTYVCGVGRSIAVTNKFVRDCYPHVIAEALRPLNYAAAATVADVTVGDQPIEGNTELTADTTLVFHPPVVVSAKKAGAGDGTAKVCHVASATPGVTFADVAKACAEQALTVKERGGKNEWSHDDFVADVDLTKVLTASVIVGAKAAGVTIAVRVRRPDNSVTAPTACKDVVPANSVQFGEALFQECGDLAVKLGNACKDCKPKFTRDTVAEVANANGNKLAAEAWPGPDAPIAADLTITLDQPLVVKVLQNVAGQNGQNTLTAAVARYAAKKLNAAFVTALNADLKDREAMAGLTIRGKEDGVALDAGASLDVVCRANGNAVIAWDADLTPTDTIDCEYFPSFAPLFEDNQPFAGANKIAWNAGGADTLPEHRTKYRAVDAHDNVKLDTTDQDSVAVTKPKSDEVVYLNCGSGKFVGDVDGARAQALTALYTADGKAKPFDMTHAGLWTALTGASGTASPARVLKRSLEAAHGNAFVHFGYGYFDIHVKVWKTIDMSGANLAHAAQKRIGWVCAADNHRAVVINIGHGRPALHVRNGAGMHSEQRCLEYLRLFVRKLEASPKNNVKMQVTRIESRWVNEWYPDELSDNHCMWALQYVQRQARDGYFREAQYNEAVRPKSIARWNLVPDSDPEEYVPVLKNLATRLVWVKANRPANGGADPQYRVIEFGDPRIHYLYEGAGKQQRRNNACNAYSNLKNHFGAYLVADPTLRSLCRRAPDEDQEKAANDDRSWANHDAANAGVALNWARDWTLGTA